MVAQRRITRWLTSLRARMLVMLSLVALVPLVTLAILDERAARASLTAASYRSLAAAAGQTANRLDNFFTTNLEVIATESALPVLGDFLVASPRGERKGRERVVETLASFAVKDRNFISSSALLDLGGRNVIDTTPANIGRDESDWPCFREALLTNLPYASRLRFHRNGRPSLCFSSPVRDTRGRIVGVLRTEYDAAVLQQLVIQDAELLGAWPFPLLVDDRGVLLAYGAASHGRVADLLFEPLASLPPERVRAPDAKFRIEGPLAFRGRGPWTAAVRRLSQMPWSVIFVQPEHVFLAPVADNTRKTVHLVLACGAFVAIVAVVVAHLLARPVEHLTRVARRIAAGDFGTRIHVGEGGEIGILAESIDDMAAQVQQRERALSERAEDLARSQRALQNETLILETILNSMSDGVAVADEAGRFLVWNDAATRITGREAADRPPSEWPERYGLFLPDRVTPYPPNLLPMVRALRGESVDRAELFMRSPREERGRWLSVSARPLCSEGDRVRGGVVVFSDVTELHERAEALRESHLRLQAFIDNATAVITMKDLAGRFILVNRRFEELFHVDRSDVVGKTDYDVLPKEIADTLRAHEVETLRAGEPRQWEEQMPHEDGLHTYLSVRFALPDAGGVVQAIGKFSTDITDRQRADEERARLVEQLRDAVRARDEFLAVASHELKTPLTPLKLHAQSLRRQLQRGGGVATGRVEQALAIFDKQIDRLTALIESLLDMTRVSGGQLRLTFEEVDLSEVVRETVTRFRPEIAAARCPIELGLATGLVGRWDRIRVEQIFTNLLTNALKYASGRPLRVVTEPCAGGARLIVADTGIGVAPEDRDRIFRPFERAVSYHNISGFGLGLYIVRRVVEAHGGSIHLESEPGQGSIFTVDLPLRPKASVGQSENAEAVAAH